MLKSRHVTHPRRRRWEALDHIKMSISIYIPSLYRPHYEQCIHHTCSVVCQEPCIRH